MATYPSITLAGGVKAPARTYSAGPTVPVALSLAHGAFAALTDALAEAIQAAELRNDPAAWDVAYRDPDRAAEAALEAVAREARRAGDAPILIMSDRRLAFAARFIAAALAIKDGADRAHVLYFIAANHALLGTPHPGPTARRVDALIRLALERLLQLTALQNGIDPDQAARDFEAHCDAPMF